MGALYKGESQSMKIWDLDQTGGEEDAQTEREVRVINPNSPAHIRGEQGGGSEFFPEYRALSTVGEEPYQKEDSPPPMQEQY